MDDAMDYAGEGVAPLWAGTVKSNQGVESFFFEDQPHAK